MEQKITIQQFAERVASVSGIDKTEALAVIKLIFKNVAERLHDGDPVTVEGLGRFELSKKSAERVSFVPDEALARAVNAPFEPFKAVELSEDFTVDADEQPTVDPVKQVEETPTGSGSEQEPVEKIEQIDTFEETEPLEQVESVIDVETAPQAPELPKETVQQPAVEMPAVPPVVPPAVPTPTPPPFDPVKAYRTPSIPVIEEEEEEEVYAGDEEEAAEPQKKGGKFMFGLLTGIVIAAAIAALAFFVYEVFLV